MIRQINKLAKGQSEIRNKFESYRSLAAIIVGLICMIVGYQIGNVHLGLILNGVRTQGVIVDHALHSSSFKGSTSSSYIPIVEFTIENRVVRFSDWKGTQSPTLDRVGIIYKSEDPAVAMIDRPVWNWLPWGPIFLLGLLLTLVSIKNWLKFSAMPPQADANIGNASVSESKFFETEIPSLADTVFSNVSWKPVKHGGANFKTQHMHVAESRIVIKPSGSALRFYLFFGVLGLVGQVAGGLLIYLNHAFASGAFMLILGALFDVLAFLLFISDKPMVFDKLAGIYFRGSALPPSASTNHSRQGQLSAIHAIQLVDEVITSKSPHLDTSAYTSYEINLVFKDGARINVMDHGDLADVEESAKQLGRFLGVPIWRKSV